MLRVKVCGITNKDDANMAVNAGASALGFIFYRKSPRYIPPVKAGDIVKDLPPFVDRVGVFVDMNLPGLIAIIRKVGLSAVQLHGKESPEYCFELKAISSIPIIKAIRVKDESSLAGLDRYVYAVNAFLLDTYKKDVYGGTGETFNWHLVKRLGNLGRPIILSGGLTPANALEAYNIAKPYALDVNSGVEISPGLKDHTKLRFLFERLNTLPPDKR